MSELQVKKVKTAVIGCGMISHSYIRNLMQMFSIIDLVAVCDINPAAAEEKRCLYGVQSTMTADEIAADPQIELVVNLTAPVAHYAVIKQMLEAGKHVYTEKPFAARLDQAWELAELADRLGLSIAVAPDAVLGAQVQTARKMIDSGLVGKITSGLVSVTRNHNLNSEVYRFLQKEGGALPYDLGIYYIAALIALLGSVKAVRGFGAPAPHHQKELLFDEGNGDGWTIPGNNLLTAGLSFAGGALVSLHFNGNAVGAEQHCFELYGTEGMLALDDPNTFGGPVQWTRPESAPVLLPFTHGYNGIFIGEQTPYEHFGHRGVGAAELAWAIRQGRKSRLNQAYGLHCLEVLHGLDEAARTGMTYEMQSSCQVKPLRSGFYSSMDSRKLRGDAERSLVD
ncbi:MAG: Gfo/Idh/MocA family oxidoreductase [Oscillospiraceae bacterium]|jgi:predicted dehydrogenase|nr:Gfo/Idh/MocA family oxidoreductase [Oscillospiraceae bacterium]